MPVVVLRDGESVEKAIKRLSRLVTKAGIIKTIKKNRFYEKPSDERRRSRIRSMKRTPDY